MKQIFFMIFSLCAITLFAQDYKFPGWKCNDPQQLLQAEMQTEDPYEIGTCRIIRLITEQKISSYTDYCITVDAVVDTLQADSEKKNIWKLSWKKNIPLNRDSWLSDAWNFCKKNPSSYDIFFAMYRSGELYLSDTEIYQTLNYCLLKYNYDAATVREAVDRIIEKAVLADVTSQKEDLKKLNRKYSGKLWEDKNAWEPVVVTIRTIIETW